MEVEDKKVLFENEPKKPSLDELDKNITKAEVLEACAEENKSYMDIQMSQNYETESENKQAPDLAEEQVPQEKQDDQSNDSLPSVEVSFHDNNKKDGESPEGETENLLSVIEEERSDSTPLSEVNEEAANEPMKESNEEENSESNQPEPGKKDYKMVFT